MPVPAKFDKSQIVPLPAGVPRKFDKSHIQAVNPAASDVLTDTGAPAGPSFIDKLTEIQKPDPNHPWDYHEALKAIGNIGASGMGMILHPIDTVASAMKLGLNANPAAYLYHRLTGTPDPVAEMAKQFAENPYGTVEAGIGQAAVAEALPHVLKPIVGKASDVAQAGIRRVAGSGPGVASKLLRQVIKENRAIDLENSSKEMHNRASENTLALRQQHEQAYQQATEEHYAKEAAADIRAKADENAAWSAWRKKITGKTMDGSQITGPLQKLRLDSPEVDRTLNQLEPRGDEVPQESPYAQLRARVSQEHFGKDYESLSPVKQDEVDDLLHNSGYSPEPIAFDPQPGQPVSIDRVQRASSILQRYIRSGRFEGPPLGEMKQVAKVLRDAVTRASADAGAAPELNASRAATITYQEAFGKERRLPSTARTIREKDVNPEAYRERATEERLARARRYDPSLVDSYRKVKAAREALKKFPTEDQLRKGLQQKSPRHVISGEDLRIANEEAVRKRASGLAGHLFLWSGAWPAFHMLSDFVRGNEVSLKPLALMPAAGAAGMAAEEIMRQPPVMDFLTRATRQQVARIPPELRGSMPEIVAAAKARGVQVSPILAAYAAAIQRNQNAQQKGQQ